MNEGWSSSCCNNNTAILSHAEEQGKESHPGAEEASSPPDRQTDRPTDRGVASHPSLAELQMHHLGTEPSSQLLLRSPKPQNKIK